MYAYLMHPKMPKVFAKSDRVNLPVFSHHPYCSQSRFLPVMTAYIGNILCPNFCGLAFACLFARKHSCCFSRCHLVFASGNGVFATYFQK